MARTRKQSLNWYIAATHYLTSGFFFPGLAALILAFIIIPLIGLKTLLLPPVYFLFILGSWILGMWWGVMYSARHLNKWYIIKEKRKIVSLSTNYYIVLYIIGVVCQFILNGVTIITIVYAVIFLGITTFLFYLFSKKYIKDEDEILTSKPEL